MALAITLDRKFLETEELPAVCVVTGVAIGVQFRGLTVVTPLEGQRGQTLQKDIELPFTGSGWRLWRVLQGQDSLANVVMVVVVFALVFVMRIWMLRTMDADWAGASTFGTVALAVVIGILLRRVLLPRLTIVDSFGSVRIDFPARRQDVYEQYCLAYEQWKARQRDGLQRDSGDTDDWSTHQPQQWDQA